MRRVNFYRVISLSLVAILLALSMGANKLYLHTEHETLSIIANYSFMIAISIMIIIFIHFFIDNKIYKGLRYFKNYWLIRYRLFKQLGDANFSIDRGWYHEFPKIILTFSDDFQTGTLKISNALKFDKKLDSVVMSSALRNYVVERHYLSDDENYYIYELLEASKSFCIQFNAGDDFIRYSQKIDDYSLFLDSRSVIKLQHALIVGMTGSGKTYALYSLILQMMSKKIPYELYFSDPKGSSVDVIGSIVNPNNNAVGFDEIVMNLKKFVSNMRERKPELSKLLKTKLDADYSDFGLSPHIFIFDEYASFASILSAQEKKVRDEVKSLLYEVILQGRQLGFFMFLVMQKSDSHLIETAIRDNMPLKIVLGNSETTTYVTAFGSSDIPSRHYKIGEGVFTEPRIAPQPKLVQFPFLNFDVLKTITTLNAGYVITRVPEQKSQKKYFPTSKRCINTNKKKGRE